MKSRLYCSSCNRKEGTGTNDVETIAFQDAKWCSSCADIKKLNGGETYVSMPSPGRMTNGEYNILTTWQDCYSMKPKKKILKKQAKNEITRAWDLWEEDKTQDLSMFFFFGWLTKYRPYFLTFRDTGSQWQTVHSWLIRHEGLKNKNKQ